MGQSKDPDIYNCGLSFFVKSVALAFIFKVHIHARSKVSALMVRIIDLVRLLFGFCARTLWNSFIREVLVYNMVHCGLYRLQTTVLSYNIGASEMVVLEFQKAVCPEDFRRRLERDFGCLHNRLLGK